AGSPPARAQVDQVVASTQCQKRDPQKLKSDVLQMRSDIAAHKHSKGVLDVKLQRGGLVDVEFLVHFLQLRHAAEYADKHAAMLAPDFATAIPALIELDLLERELWLSYDLMTDVLVAGRLLAPEGKEPPPAAAKALAKACGHTSYAELLADVANARQCVARCWAQNFEENLEI
ncbi:MAG: glutamine-synthetase adenylyltransferase, partial [Erythrobacter sp.]